MQKALQIDRGEPELLIWAQPHADKETRKGPAVVACRENLSWCPSEILWILGGEMPGMILGHQLVFSLRPGLQRKSQSIMSCTSPKVFSRGKFQSQVQRVLPCLCLLRSHISPGSYSSVFQLSQIQQFLHSWRYVNWPWKVISIVFQLSGNMRGRGFSQARPWLSTLLCVTALSKEGLWVLLLSGTSSTLSWLVHLLLMPQQCLE